MNNIDSIVEKIQKLFSLAGNNPSKEEAKSALLKAQELMAKYNIEQEELNKSGLKYTYELFDTRVKERGIHNTLASVIATSFSCRVLGSAGYICVFGRSDNANAACEAIKFAFKVMRKGAHKEIRDLGLNSEGSGVAPIYNTYCMGFIAGLKSSMEAQCVALAIIVPQDVTDEMNSRFNLRDGRRSKFHADSDTERYNRGFKAGSTVMAKRGIEA